MNESQVVLIPQVPSERSPQACCLQTLTNSITWERTSMKEWVSLCLDWWHFWSLQCHVLHNWSAKHSFSHFVNENPAACSSLTWDRKKFIVSWEKIIIMSSHENYPELIGKLCKERAGHKTVESSAGTKCALGIPPDKHPALKYNALEFFAGS